jgi:hypothetical protein
MFHISRRSGCRLGPLVLRINPDMGGCAFAAKLGGRRLSDTTRGGLFQHPAIGMPTGWDRYTVGPAMPPHFRLGFRRIFAGPKPLLSTHNPGALEGQHSSSTSPFGEENDCCGNCSKRPICWMRQPPTLNALSSKTPHLPTIPPNLPAAPYRDSR